MSSRVRNTKKLIPSADVLPVTSEDDLLGPGDGNSKFGQKSILKSSKSKDNQDIEVKGGNDTVDTSNDVIMSRDEKLFSLLAQMQKKDDQIEKLSESVSCMAKEIQKLNSVIFKLQEQVARSQENTSTTSKGVHNIPFSKVSQPEGKKNGLTADKTPFSKVPRDVAKKTVKFVDVVKRDMAKTQKQEKEEIQETVLEIQASSWKGKDLTYLILFESGIEKWIKSSDCASIQGMVNEFHKQNPGAPNGSDYSLADSIKMEYKKKRNIMAKIKKNQASKLQAEDIGFIATALVQEVNKPKEFSKVAFGIANKRIFKGFTYAQKQTTIKKIIHQYGLNQKVARISLVGDSVLELYTIKEEEEIVIARMKSNGWNLINFNPEELPEFSRQKDEVAQQTALINRIGFLYAGTTLINLRKILVEGISESTRNQIIKKAEEIVEKRTAIKEGRAQAKLVQKSEL
jgi:hypothetical protein